MKQLYTFLFLACCMFAFASCTKDSSTGAMDTDADNLTATVKSSVSGFVTDENNLPVPNATVSAGIKSTFTDQFGFFEIKDAELIKNAAFVTVAGPGFFKGIKTWVAKEGRPAFFRVKLLKKANAGSVSAAAGGDVVLAGGMKITFPASAIADAATGAAYTGMVSVAAQWIDPLSNELEKIMPGDLRGQDANGRLKILTTYGMAAVELTGAAGQLLQIAAGKKAILTMPLPPALSASAPASIPLWHFDEAKGLWKEEGSAAKAGNAYVGEVSHFSFWNVDVTNSNLAFDCRVLDNAGLPVPNVLVKISFVNSPLTCAYGYTNALGYVSGAVPANVHLRLDVVSNNVCSNTAYTQAFTTGTSAINLGDLIIGPAASVLSTLKGKILNCANAPVTTGYVIIKDGYTYYRHALNNDGTYNINILSCSLPHAVYLIGEDAVSSTRSIPVAYSIAAGGINLVPNIQSCSITNQEFINYTVDGAAYSFSIPADHITDSLYSANSMQHSIKADRIPASSAGFVWLHFFAENIAVGSSQRLRLFYTPEVTYIYDIASQFVSVNISEYGPVGGYVSGDFVGIVTGSSPTVPLHEFTCSFRVKRGN